MGPSLLEMPRGQSDPEVLSLVTHHLVRGGLVGMPTETVYGFGCIVDVSPMRKLQRLKARGPEKPFLLLIPGIEWVPDLDWVAPARELAAVFWPGALTLILRDPNKRFPPGVRSPMGGVAVRVSPHPLVSAVVGALGRPVVSTSANSPGGLPATTAAEALETARALGAGDELWVLDGGPLNPSEPSTIVDCTGPAPVVRRAGAIPVNRLRCVLPDFHEPS